MMVTRRFLAVTIAVAVMSACSTAPGSSGSGGVPEEPTESGATSEEPTESGGTSEEPGESAPVGETVDWNRDEVDYGHCAPDKQPADTLAFGPPVGAEMGELGGVVRHGVVANDEGELFRIDVFGENDAFVEEYLAQLAICLDAVVTQEPAEEAQEGPLLDEARPEGEFGPEDLIIQIALLGFVDPARDPGGIAKELGPMTVDDWTGILEEIQASPDVARPEFVANGYIIDALIDPGMNANVRHQYREITSTRIYTKVTTSGGKVRAGLCRSSWSPVRTADVGSGASANLSDSQTRWYVYDLAVKGLASSNRYMLSSSWYTPGWASGYWALAPTGSARTCYV